jgi:predicted nuclease of predicted toxin-antitoxin system
VIIITKDTDFSDLILNLGAPPKIIKIQTGNCDNKILYSLIQDNIEKAVRMLITFDKNIVEINNQKLL